MNRIRRNNRGASLCLLLVLATSSKLVSGQPTATSSSPSHFHTALSILKAGHVRIQLGGYWGIQGVSQHINIDGLIGDSFIVTNDRDSNAVVGLGYFIENQAMSYGVNAFYLPNASVFGNVMQENVFTNLSFSYHITHYPIYAMAQSEIPIKLIHQTIKIDVGIGPNFMQTRGFQEYSLDNGVTIPDNEFSGRTTTTLSATVGLSIQIKDVFGKVPLECGYRFYYLGQGQFNSRTDQVQNTLNTGNTYANALLCGIRI